MSDNMPDVPLCDVAVRASRAFFAVDETGNETRSCGASMTDGTDNFEGKPW